MNSKRNKVVIAFDELESGMFVETCYGPFIL